MAGKLVLGEDVGGPRHFLEGKEVHCGQILEMKTPKGWVPVRYEASLYPGDVRVYLYTNPWTGTTAHAPHSATEGRPRPECYRCGKIYDAGSSETCDEPDWGPTVVVAGRPDDFKRIPEVELRWPDPKRDDRSLFDRD